MNDTTLSRGDRSLSDLSLSVLDPAFWPAVAFGGSVGAGEA